MNKETREQVALFRYKLLSPVLAEPNRVQNEYFRDQASKEHNVPHYGCRSFSVSTLKGWLLAYRVRGFEGLKPKERADQGRPRRIDDATLEFLRHKVAAFPHYTVRKLYEQLRDDHLLGDPAVCYNTILRTLHREQLVVTGQRKDLRKRFERDEVNELWTADFMHGPVVRAGNRRAKAILCAIIDDHSRMLVGYEFFNNETVSSLVVVLKEALLAFGLPKRLYVDNGSAFSADLLQKSCAQAQIALIHSKPYDSPSRGKIERFFRTVRERFLPGLVGEVSLEDLNAAFAAWLREDYHHKLHSGIEQRPIDRYHASAGRVSLRRLARAELEEIFLVRAERIVNNDATLSFKGRIYEVPSAYIRQKVELRHRVDDDQDLALYDKGQRIAKLKLVDVRENAETFRPSPSDSAFSFAKGKVMPCRS